MIFCGKGRKAAMRKDKKDNSKKERIVMIASSAFVLTALTLTGIYMQTGDEESKDNGYTLDFTALEDSEESNEQELAQNEPIVNNPAKTPDVQGSVAGNTEDDLDYMPLEAGSDRIEIPGVTTVLGDEYPIVAKPQVPIAQEEAEPDTDSEAIQAAAPAEEENTEPAEPEQNLAEQTDMVQTDAVQTDAEQANADQVVAEQSAAPELHFAESNILLRPLEGEVLIPFSMDGSVYFSTLDQYKYNPAVMLVAQEGSSVFASAAGKVVDIFQDAEIGQAVTMDLGDGYQITYGQLQGVMVAKDSYVNPGDMIGSVAAPTKYYSLEGANLYLKLTHDGIPVDPEALFQ